MPPIARIPPVEFRSLLLPPARVSLRAIRFFLRPRCAPTILPAARLSQCFTQRRTFHLYKTAKAKTVLGMHKVITFSPYEIEAPSISDHKVNLVVSDTDSKFVAENISLQELYDNHVQPGHMLYLAQDLSRKTAESYDKLKDGNIPGETRSYAIVKAQSTYAQVKTPQKGAQLGALKIIIFNLASPIAYVKMVLDKAYQFIESGSPVEIRIRLKGAKLTKAEGLLPGDAEVWPWMHNHFPHLRPDFIMKAMPEGTIYLVNPVSDGRIVQFVLTRPAATMPHIDLTTRLLRVQKSVKQSIDLGKQGRLPVTLRDQIHAAGNKEYSGKTGMPRSQAAKTCGPSEVDNERWGFEETGTGKPAVSDDN